ncbi:MAG: KamA family radical SAM protein [Methanocorpusculum sp.]|nr:KamA family radical SAM protein [Methanocorpusculum sp.]
MENWQKNLQKNIHTIEELSDFIKMSEKEKEELSQLLEKYPMSVTKYYLSLIDKNDINDPIRKICVPTVSEKSSEGRTDTSGELENTILPGLQHKYRETALVLSTNACAVYCRYCFRKRLVGAENDEVVKSIDKVAGYIKNHTEINNVLISGGDSFLMSNERIEKYLEKFSDISHIDYIRFATRVPVVFPERITDDSNLIEIIRKFSEKKQIYVVTHFNHPKECTEESAQAIGLLKNSGVIIKNQSVLLRGINDSPETLSDLFRKLVRMGVVPYYVFQCRPVKGVKNQFQVPLLEGCEIIENTKRLLDGQEKAFRYIMSHVTGKIEIIGCLPNEKVLFKYHQAKDRKRLSKIFAREISPEQCWL